MKISIISNEFLFGGSVEKMFETLNGFGYGAIDYLGHGFDRFQGEEEKAYCKRLTEAAKKYGMEIGQTHAPFYINSSEEEFLGERLKKWVEQAIERTARLGVKYIVCHPYVPRGVEECAVNAKPYDYSMFIDHNKEVNLQFFNQFIPLLKSTGVKMCIENLFAYDVLMQRHALATGGDPDEMNYYVDQLGDECFACCYDSGHLNHFGADEETYIKKLGKRIKVTHFNDSWGKDFKGMDWHLMPGQGDVNWDKVAKTLKEIGYEGNANFEVSPRRGKLFTPQLRYIAEAGNAIFNEE